jgi:hypothetical protein
MMIQPVTLIVPGVDDDGERGADGGTMPPWTAGCPPRAVAGVFIRCRPSTKQVAAATYSSWMTQCEGAHDRAAASLAADRLAGAAGLPAPAGA